MSHNTELEFAVKDFGVLEFVIRQLGGVLHLGKQTVAMFTRNKVEAIGRVVLPKWKYDIALTENGKLVYDNWGSQEGSMDLLYGMISNYTLEATERLAKRQRRRSRRFVTNEKPGWQFVDVYV